MAKELMSIKTINGDELFGYKWLTQKAKANLVIVTGMEEYAARYDGFATFMNENVLAATTQMFLRFSCIRRRNIESLRSMPCKFSYFLPFNR
jgi:hypothetical protein